MCVGSNDSRGDAESDERRHIRKMMSLPKTIADRTWHFAYYKKKERVAAQKQLSKLQSSHSRNHSIGRR